MSRAQSKRFHVYGWVLPTAKAKESDGKKHIIGEFDSLEEAKAVRLEHWRAGWGPIEIRDLAKPQ
jgi:hypothetical protein